MLEGCQSSSKTFRRFLGPVLASSFVVLLSIIPAPNVRGQQSIGGGPILSPLVPTQDARPLPSPLEQRNLVQRPSGDQDSISSLIKSVSNSDSTVELVIGRGKLITLQEPLALPEGGETPVVAVGDPTVLDFDILPSSRMIRVLGRRVGMTDLSVVTSTGKAYSFDVRVVYDLNLLRAYIKQQFPNANLTMVQMYEHVVVEGEAASTDQVYQILQAMNAFLTSAQVARTVKNSNSASPYRGGVPVAPNSNGAGPENVDPNNPDAPARLPFEGGIDDKPDVTSTLPAPQIINLIRVPGVQQVMLQVKIAEINRTALRQMGASVLYQDSSGRTFGSLMGTSGLGEDGGLFGLALGSATTSFAIIPNAAIAVALDALRNNRIATILAEPNLMAMHGQKASFLAGGEFPVPVPQGGGNNNAITIQFKEFGVLLDFVPYIMEDGTIRLHVAPEVSTIDRTIGIITDGISVPGVNTRRASTTVELHEGQTLALAGLLQVDLQADTNRLPGLGDLPYLGPFFSNNSHQRAEKELVILVSPSFVKGMEPNQVGPLPGCEVSDPDDREFYLMSRIESRLPNNSYRATNGWDDPLNIREAKKSTRSHLQGLFGPHGFSR